MEEIWQAVEEFPNYLVSNYGYIINRNSNRIIRGRPNDRGYIRVTLYSQVEIEDGSMRTVGHTRYLAQLVAQAFFGDWREGLRVTHNDGDKSNNALWNLKLRQGIVGMHYESRKAFTGKPIRVVETGEEFRTVKDAATYLGGDFASIYKVLRGKRKRHLGYTFEYIEGE